MADREKVIKALELCTSKIETRTQIPCETCPYHNRKYHGVLGDGCCNARSLQRDALALLKAQEAVEPVQDIVGDALFWVCGKCGHDIKNSDWYCANCGRKVKWNG